MFPEINWSKFIDYSYWFEGLQNNPGAPVLVSKLANNSWFFWFFLILFGSFITIGILMKLFQLILHREHPLQTQFPFWSNNLIWMGLLGIVWFLCRQVQIAILGTRPWLLVGLVWFLVILGLAIRYFVKFYFLELRYFIKTYLQKQ
jgi:hypothetical protein